MTNEILGYIKDVAYALLTVLLVFGVALTQEQIAAIMTLILAIGALALFINSRLGKPKEIREDAKAAQRAGVAPSRK